VAFVYNDSGFGLSPIQDGRSWAAAHGILVVDERIVSMLTVDALSEMRALGVVGYLEIRHISTALIHDTVERAEARYLGVKARLQSVEVASLARRYAASLSEADKLRLKTQLDDRANVWLALLDQIEMGAEERLAVVDPQENAQIAEVRSVAREYLDHARAVMAAHDAEGRPGPETAAALDRFEAARARTLETILRFEELETSLLYSSLRQAALMVRRSLWTVALFALAAVVGCLVLGAAVVRSITRPLGRLAAAARRVAEGDLGPVCAWCRVRG
jgi:methyl-accepting chemotaxis protein